MKSKILLVDDDPFTRSLFENLFRNGDIDLTTATNVAQARQAFDVIHLLHLLRRLRHPDIAWIHLRARLLERLLADPAHERTKDQRTALTAAITSLRDVSLSATDRLAAGTDLAVVAEANARPLRTSTR